MLIMSFGKFYSWKLKFFSVSYLVCLHSIFLVMFIDFIIKWDEGSIEEFKPLPS